MSKQRSVSFKSTRQTYHSWKFSGIDPYICNLETYRFNKVIHNIQDAFEKCFYIENHTQLDEKGKKQKKWTEVVMVWIFVVPWRRLGIRIMTLNQAYHGKVLKPSMLPLKSPGSPRLQIIEAAIDRTNIAYLAHLNSCWTQRKSIYFQSFNLTVYDNLFEITLKIIG